MNAWHYTTAKKFDLIMKSGMLLPAYIGVVEPELPILWFSTHSRYEPSALKSIRDGEGRNVMLTLEEMIDLTGGVVRFGCPIKRLKCGENLRKAAKMHSLVWRRLVKHGAVMKADHLDWWGHVGSMPLDEVTIEIMDSNMRWNPIPSVV